MLTRFRAGCRYRHASCIDVDIHVVKVDYITPKRCVLKVIYINRNWRQGDFVIDYKPERVDFCPDMRLWKRI